VVTAPPEKLIKIGAKVVHHSVIRQIDRITIRP
jgi:hypothetical protein